MEGFGITLWMAAVSIVLSFIIGSILGILRYTRIPVVSQLVLLWVEMIRNLPLLLIIFFVRFALPEVGIKFDVITSAIIALTVFESAMISEIIRGGLNSIEKGQIEAARSSGLTYIQTLWHIIFPQAVKRMVPPTVSQFISLLKDTSLAVIISAPDLMRNVEIVTAQNSNYVIPVFVFAAILYFVVNYILSVMAKRFELRRVH
ncbi:amino acid ABC transporter permease [Paenibacillus larvae]|uniref:Amino acid ABC transporter permease n=2 Tax=Paenibacillus larvae TaxID=1464 RepID=A0AAP5N3M2_9BACL|nr:amino acid ABC transporter permease [Paenibacillus larvae]MCY7476348.1 amino acid ABC transporter permease [Paenibacillus larvae]MCY7489713.1 amino acid ABC transporter permease [Paenibacillus larvae]MCY7522281.1 amino acid ABC transporter permease [Paenibacillus larvae]MCY9503141.1 amino acid ABC transporter permease [Paenibacillus larvae]MCY9509271.1 amino acid ABC transporter permease [Paenibacillus larvae]